MARFAIPQKLVFMHAIFLAHIFLASQADASTTPLHILVDPGHGGIDRGATRNHVRESEIALKVSLFLGELLKDDARFQVSMTR